MFFSKKTTGEILPPPPPFPSLELNKGEGRNEESRHDEKQVLPKIQLKQTTKNIKTKKTKQKHPEKQNTIKNKIKEERASFDNKDETKLFSGAHEINTDTRNSNTIFPYELGESNIKTTSKSSELIEAEEEISRDGDRNHAHRKTDHTPGAQGGDKLVGTQRADQEIAEIARPHLLDEGGGEADLGAEQDVPKQH